MSNDLSMQEILSWREEFPLLKRKIHLGNCSQSPLSNRVHTAINAYVQSLLENGMDWGIWMGKVHEAKVQFAQLINADVDEIAVTMSVSDATSGLASALRPQTNRFRVLTTEMEFPTVGQVWLANERRGWEVEFVPERGGQLYTEDFEACIDSKTALVSTTHVSYQTGARVDIRALGDIAHKNGALLYVDAYQSLGTVPVDVKRDNIDFLASGTLKYLLGIPGIAFFYAKRDLSNDLSPTVTGWFGQENPFAMETTRLDYASSTRRFDTGTPPIMAAYAAAAGLSIINEVGVERIRQRILCLTEFALTRATELGFAVLGPSIPTDRGATIALARSNAQALESELMNRGIIVSARGPALRLAPHFFSTEDDIATALEELKNIKHE